MHTVPEYSMSIQACIPVALATLHNFNCKYKESEPDCKDDDPIGGGGNGIGDEAVHNEGVDKPNAMQDQIVAVMWTQYLEEHVCHGVPMHV